MGSILRPAVEARSSLPLRKAEVAMRTPISGTRRTTLWLLVSAARRVGTCSGTGAILSRHTDLICHTALLLWLHGPYLHGV